jgi:hypothetical protein
MPLTPGTKLGPYEIVAPLGAGGMGEVYRARDSRLNREVAIKVLSGHLSERPEVRARFEREAKTISSLNHPHICTLFDIGREGETNFLVMELIEGETLAARIARGPLPLDEVFRLGMQIADALDRAHRSSIVHRDLKPGNIMLTKSGAKLMDFGLARASGIGGAGSGSGAMDSLGQSPTIAQPLTAEGTIVGTFQYMAPEQLEGKEADARSDIWSLGCVLYEMMTGQHAFEGTSQASLIAAIINSAPVPVSQIAPMSPPAVDRLVRQCLTRDPDERWQSAGDVRRELEWIGTSSSQAAAVAAAPRRRRNVPQSVWGILGGVAIALLAVTVWVLLRPGGVSSPARANVAFERRTFDQEEIFNAAFLPHRQGIVYSAARSGNTTELFLLRAGAMTPRKIAGAGTTLLSVAPDGELAVLTGAVYSNHRVFSGTLARMSIDGAPRPLVDGVSDADWGPGGTLAIARQVEGADRLEYPLGTVIYTTTGYVSEPRVSPDGSRIAFLDHQWASDDRGWLKVCDRAGKVTTLSREFWAIEGLAWLPDGRSLVFSGSVDGSDLQPYVVKPGSGAARPILAVPSDFTVLDVDAEGRWLALGEEGRSGVVAHPQDGPDIDLSWLDSNWNPYLSPDGLTVAFCNGHGGTNYQVVTRRLDGSPITVLGEGDIGGFSPDGKWVAARLADPPGVVIYPVGAGEPRHLESGPLEQFHAVQWYPDSENVLISGNEVGKALRDYRQSIAGGPPVPVTPEGVAGRLGPNGKTILVEREDGAWQLYPLDGADPRPVAGVQPQDTLAAWSPDGKAIFVYRWPDVPARVDRIDLATGVRTPALTIDPKVRAGLTSISFNQRTWDLGRAYAYGYERTFSKLFVVTGVGD